MRGKVLEEDGQEAERFDLCSLGQQCSPRSGHHRPLCPGQLRARVPVPLSDPRGDTSLASAQYVQAKGLWLCVQSQCVDADRP